MTVLSTSVLTRPDKSAPFYYSDAVMNKKFTDEADKARQSGEIVSIEFFVSSDELSKVLTIRYRSDFDRKNFLERVKESADIRKKYCDEHGHTCEINHYV